MDSQSRTKIKKRKKTPEEIRAYNRDRQRERRRKFTAEQKEKKKEYDKNYKSTKKEQGLWKNVENMTEREARKVRRQTKERTRRCRERKTMLAQADAIVELTPNPSPNSSGQFLQALPAPVGPSRKAVGRKKKMLSRTKVYLELLKTKKREEAERRRAEKYRKRYDRLLKLVKSDSSPSPNSKVKALCGNYKLPPQVRKRLIFSEILISHLGKQKKVMSGNRTKQQEFAKLVSPKELKDEKMISSASSIVSYKAYKKATNNCPKERSNASKIDFATLIKLFLEQDINSRMCAGKKETRTKAKVKCQKRILLDSLKNLHLKFLRTHNIKISYTLFRRLKPFYIVPPKATDRDTCLCVEHANVQLIVDKLYYIKLLETNSLTNLIKKACCSTTNEICMYRKCEKCATKLNIDLKNIDPNQPIVYRKWVNKTEKRVIKSKEKDVKLMTKSTIECSIKEFLDVFWVSFNKIIGHTYEITHQYKEMSFLKQQMSENEIIVHMDFSENYQVKYSSEPQALHFGASKKQLSLHTVVCYSKRFPTGIQSFCTISSDLEHSAFAVWAHLEAVLVYINENYHEINTIHFQSDGPSSQYKNKNNVYLLLHQLPGVMRNICKWSWNFSISGHGKGPMDGIGAAVKRTADKVVLHGKDVVCVQDVIEKVQPLLPKIIIMEVHSKDIGKWKALLPVKPPPVNGIQKVHQIIWTENQRMSIEIRHLSCMKCMFIKCKHYLTGKGILSFKDEQQHTNNYPQLTKNYQRPTSNDRQEPTDENRDPTYDDQQPTYNDQKPTDDDRQPPDEVLQPSHDDRQPTDDDRQPADDDRQPAEDDQQPADDDRKPTNDDRQPPDDVLQHSHDDRQPTDDDLQPADDDRKPTNDDRQPTDDDRQPADADRKSADDDRKPTNDDRQPTDDDRQPADADRKSADDDRKPTDDDRQPPDDVLQPSHDHRQPTDDDRQPTYDDRQPANDDRQPTYDDRQPANDDRQPTDDDQQPADNSEQSASNITIGTWIAVIYDDSWYPGEVEKVEGNIISAKFMQRTGTFFKWPSKPDRQSLHVEGVLCSLEPPIKFGSRLFQFNNTKYVDDMCTIYVE